MYNKRTRRFKKGGAIDDKKAMVLSQIKEVHHHADELAKVLANMDTVDAWVVGKMERATTDLSDITHYLDGTTEYAKGGRIGKYILTFYCNESNIDEAEKIVSKYTKEWRRSLDFGKNFFFVPELTWQKAKELENEISPFKLTYPFGVSIFKAYADGGMMADGGKTDKYYVLDAKDGKIVSKGFDTEEEAKKEMYKIFEMTRNPFLIPKKMADGGMMAKGGRIKDSDIKVGSKFVLVNGDIIEIKRLFVENMDENWCEYTRNGVSQENSVKELRLFINRLDGGMMAKGGMTKKKTKGIDLFEDYQDIPPKVQKVLDYYQEDFEDGDYKGLEKALKELEKIGYTFEYGLDGIAYDLRPIGTQGKSEFMEF
jgi:hypothetical protein